MDIKKRAAALRVRIEKEREVSGGRVRFTPRLRADVVSFARSSGLSRAELSEQLSLAESLLHRWLSASTRIPICAKLSMPRSLAAKCHCRTNSLSRNLAIVTRFGVDTLERRTNNIETGFSCLGRNHPLNGF